MPARVTPLPLRGETYVDARDPDRTLRVSWRPEAGVFVLSTWRDDRCVSTFHLPGGQVPELLAGLVSQLTASPDAAGATAAG